MPVSGKELSTLDFANLIGGPLNAVVEAQAKSAITTANFIREVGFDDEGKVVTTDFSVTKDNSDGRKQNFTLSVPFLTMLPVPYIKVDEAVVEFNAKITSTTESTTESTFGQVVDASVGGRYWFVTAKVSSKTSYQRKAATADREERTFDMHVRVKASNTDMPSGTEKILNILEESMHETPGDKVLVALKIGDQAEAPDPDNPGQNKAVPNAYKVTGEIGQLVKGDKVYTDEEKTSPKGTIDSVDVGNGVITFSEDQSGDIYID